MKPGSPIRRFIERRPWIRLIFAVVTRTRELNGNYAANAVTLVAFIALFPLLLVIVSVTGLLTDPNPHLVDNVIDFLGLTQNAANTVRETLEHARASGASGSIIGLAGMTWSGLSLVGALRYAVNLPHGYGIKGIRARVIGVPWLIGAGAIFLVSVAISTMLNWLPTWTAPLAIIVSFAVDLVLFGWTFWFLDIERPSPRQLLPGAIVAAVGFGILKMLATIVLPRLVSTSSATYGALGTVFAILAWLLLVSRIFVYSVVFNAVWADRTSIMGTAGSGAKAVPRGGSAQRGGDPQTVGSPAPDSDGTDPAQNAQ